MALQLGGSIRASFAQAARIGEEFGYDEINLNVGCPSDRVKDGRFGARLRAEPELVARCVDAMKARFPFPSPSNAASASTIRIRRSRSIRLRAEWSLSGCDALIVHARKAWLNGPSPKENRDIPPLDA